MSFSNVADPQSLQARINERIRSGRAGEAGRDKAAVLDEILAELRAIREAVEAGNETSDDGPGDDGPEGESGR
jgi:hypothetical protein